MDNVVGPDVGASQWGIRRSPTSSNVSSPLCSPLLVVDTTSIIHSAPTPAPPIEHNENEIEGENRDSTKNGHSCVVYALRLFFLFSIECCYYRDDLHEIVYPDLPMARRATQKSAPPVDPMETAKSPPPVPPRTVGSKGNSSKTGELGLARSIRQERC